MRPREPLPPYYFVDPNATASQLQTLPFAATLRYRSPRAGGLEVVYDPEGWRRR